MNNAKIEASGTMTFIRNSMLTIMEKGEVNAEDISFTNGAPAALRNWGALTVANTTFRCNTLQQRNHNQQEYLNQFQYENCK